MTRARIARDVGSSAWNWNWNLETAERWARQVVRVCWLGGCVACASAPANPQRMERVYWSITTVTRAGALACAPRELALARAHYDFAQIELAQGNPKRASQHLDRAEENAGAAQVLTPERGCTANASPQPAAATTRASNAMDATEATDAACERAEIANSLEADGCKTVTRPDEIHSQEVATPPAAPTLEARVDRAAVANGGSEARSGCDAPTPDNNCPNRSYANVTISDRELKLSTPITFSGDSPDLRETTHAVLDVIVELLIDHPSMTLEIAGHTDSRGDAARNQSLSQQQAERVRQYLIDRGVTAMRLTAQGYGETRPIESNSTSRGRATNRRIELIRTDRVP